MPAKNHYKILGLEDFAKADAVKSRYRKLVRELHPDVNPDPKAATRFREITESYQVLSDPARKKSYDALLRIDMQAKAPPPPPHPRTPPPPRQAPPRAPASLRDQVAAAQRHFAAGRLRDAENEARKLIARDGKLAIAYSILGDVYQSQEKLERAAKMYALAVQFGPKEPGFQRRYEQILDRIEKEKGQRRADADGKSGAGKALGLQLLVHPVLIGYVGFAADRPAPFLTNTLVHYWTPSLLAMLLLDGILCGMVLSATGQLDRWESLGRRWLVSGLLGAVCFWISALHYGVTGVLQDAFCHSLSRLFAWCVALLFAFTLAFSVQHAYGWSQVAMWGGNLLLVGGLFGWRLMDSFRG